ncbi:MAG: polyhydroxyalkanoic acid system family protein [Bacteroidota bacterium]
MAHINILRAHSLGLDGARQAAEAVAARLVAEFGVRTSWTGDILRVEGRGVKGALEAQPTVVRVTASLGLVARPFRRALHREIVRELDRLAPLPA